jgi:hypothetical protein
VITDNWLCGFVKAKGYFGISLDPEPRVRRAQGRGLPDLGINLLISSDRSLSVPIGASDGFNARVLCKKAFDRGTIRLQDRWP